MVIVVLRQCDVSISGTVLISSKGLPSGIVSIFGLTGLARGAHHSALDRR
jgi:hypothetical protein